MMISGALYVMACALIKSNAEQTKHSWYDNGGVHIFVFPTRAKMAPTAAAELKIGLHTHQVCST